MGRSNAKKAVRGNVIPLRERDVFREELNALIKGVEDAAKRRADLAAEYADDPRHSRSAAALLRLAKNLKALPADSPGLDEYWDFAGGAFGDCFAKEYLLEFRRYYVGQYGFCYNNETGDAEDFLERLVNALTAEEGRHKDLLEFVSADRDDEGPAYWNKEPWVKWKLKLIRLILSELDFKEQADGSWQPVRRP